jgi:hypothetical protein
MVLGGQNHQLFPSHCPEPEYSPSPLSIWLFEVPFALFSPLLVTTLWQVLLFFRCGRLLASIDPKKDDLILYSNISSEILQVSFFLFLLRSMIRSQHLSKPVLGGGALRFRNVRLPSDQVLRSGSWVSRSLAAFAVCLVSLRRLLLVNCERWADRRTFHVKPAGAETTAAMMNAFECVAFFEWAVHHSGTESGE